MKTVDFPNSIELYDCLLLFAPLFSLMWILVWYSDHSFFFYYLLLCFPWCEFWSDTLIIVFSFFSIYSYLLARFSLICGDYHFSKCTGDICEQMNGYQISCPAITALSLFRTQLYLQASNCMFYIANYKCRNCFHRETDDTGIAGWIGVLIIRIVVPGSGENNCRNIRNML